MVKSNKLLTVYDRGNSPEIKNVLTLQAGGAD